MLQDRQVDVSTPRVTIENGGTHQVPTKPMLLPRLGAPIRPTPMVFQRVKFPRQYHTLKTIFLHANHHPFVPGMFQVFVSCI